MQQLKTLIYSLLLLSSLGTLYAQSTSTDQNYVKETIYRRPADINGSIYVLNSNNHYITTTYTDGLGRPIQQIQQNLSPDDDMNIVTHIEYEKNIGQTRQYLPFLSIGKKRIDFQGGGSIEYNSNYVEDAKQKTHTFYSSQKYEYTPNPYSENRLERAPSQRVLESSAPGRDWHMELGEHTIKYSYDFNDKNKETVYQLHIETYWDDSSGLYHNKIRDLGTYAHNSLHKTIVKNENWKPEDGLDNTTEEFKRVDGKVVLKRTYNKQDPHDTYYVYDRFGNLAYVLSPEGESKMDQDQFDRLGYQYLYDHKNRLAAKKLPGKDWEYIVYDKADRIVMTGPVHNPFGEGEPGWLISKYDVFNRVVYTGFFSAKSSFGDRKNFQEMIQLQDPINERKTTSGSIDNQPVWYSNDLFPKDINLLTVNYYDDYAFPDAPTQFPVVQGTATQTAVKGLATGSRTRILQSSNDYAADRSYTLYDVRYRPLRVFTQNYLDGFTQNDHTYSFTGQVLSTSTTHKRTASDELLTIADTYTYDNRDRLLSHSQSVNGAAAQRIAENSYDELGALSLKKVGGLLAASSPLQRVTHTYNIRGWLKQINPSYLHFADEGNTLFGYELNYNTSEYDISAPYQYNGNINSVRWRTATDNQTRGTAFRYDKLNRLGESTMLRYNYNESPRAGYFEPIGAYGEQLSYDKNGNIQRLLRTGQEVNGQPLDLDDLIYRYHGNQLTEVTDQTNNPDGFHDGHTDGRDYEYDHLGNMVIDRNKDIRNIRYNHLNLPLEINIKDHGIRYLYDANGTKVAKIVKTDQGEKTTDYLGGFQYYEEELQFFPTEEGYVYPKDKKEYLYVYQYKDHLGNVRLSYQDINGDGSIQPTEILEENNYYPFGLKQEGYNDLALNNGNEQAQKYKYNNKEWQSEHAFNTYDYGARNYDPALGRFFNIDRLAEKYEAISPYAYVANNPIKFIDINGEWINIYDSGNKYRYMTGGQVQQWSSELGRWETVQMSEVSTYVATIIESIYELESSGATGGAVVGYFQNDNKTLNISDYRNLNGFKVDGNGINVDKNYSLSIVMTTKGLQQMTLFLTLGHEMAHVIDGYENPSTYKDIWLSKSNGETIHRSEIFASHIENQIRSESGLPLRKFYALSKMESAKFNSPNHDSKLIDSKGNSLFYKQTLPSIFDAVNRGEIFNSKYKHIKTKEAYNYYINNPKTKK